MCPHVQYSHLKYPYQERPELNRHPMIFLGEGIREGEDRKEASKEGKRRNERQGRKEGEGRKEVEGRIEWCMEGEGRMKGGMMDGRMYGEGRKEW